MKCIKTTDAVGHVLCHDITRIVKDVVKDTAFRKGHIVQEEDIPVLLTASEDILEHLINKEQVHWLAKEINKLDDIYKSVLELKYVNNFSNDEIASFLNLKKKTVEMRLYRANLILREKLKGQGDE